MSIKYFSPLSESEVELLVEAPALVTVLIAGADSSIDKKEKAWGKKLVSYRTFTSDTKLHDYYERVDEGFEATLNQLVDSWTPESQETIAAKLAQVNDILPKLDEVFANLLKDSWKSLARKVAEASGGLIGFGSVNADEARLIELPMIK